MAPFFELYKAILNQINDLKIPTYTPSQEVPKKLPICRVSILNGDANELVKNMRR